MSKKAAWLLVFALAGCASSQGPDESQAAARSRSSAKIHTELAAAYYERGQYAISLQETETAIRFDADYAPVYNMRALVRMALLEDKEAEADFRRSMRLDEANSEARNNYGWFLCQRGRGREGMQQFMDALKNPLYATPESAWLNAGVCSKKMGQLKEADEYLQRALILRPGYPGALYGLADLNYLMRDFQSAKRYFLRFTQAVQELNAEQLLLGVRIERKVGDRNSEASYALQLRKRFPDARETQLLNQVER